MDPSTRRVLASLNNSAAADAAARKMETPVKFKDLPNVLERALSPTFRGMAGIAQAQTRTDLSVAALVELLAAKGLITQEEYSDVETKVTQQFVEAAQGDQPVSPIQEQAQAEAGERKVQRLVEVPGGNLPAESETLNRTRLDG